MLHLVGDESGKYNRYNQHDRGYKNLLSSKQTFRQLVMGFIPEQWAQSLDESSIILINKSFVSHTMREKESDLLYCIHLDSQEIIFYMLLELQREQILEVLDECEEVETMLGNLGRVISEGYQKARNEGAIQGKAELIANMLEKGLSATDVSELTGLDEKTLQELLGILDSSH